MRKYYFLFLLLLLAPALAEVSECVNNSVSTCPSGVALRNLTIVTGVQGSTLLYCSANADCVDTGYFKCFSDIDGVSSSPYSGWCNATSITSCYVNGTAYATGYYYCGTSTSYQQCSSGAWGTSTSCTGNATCTSGTSSPCATSTTTTTTTGGTSSSNASATPTPTPATASVSITSAISNFDLVQGDSVVKSLTAKNNGNKALTNVKLTITGISADVPVAYSASPEKFSNLTINSTATFIVNFSAPLNATVKSYSAAAEVSSSETSASAAFTLRVLPSNATIENTILPLFSSLKSVVADLEKNITDLESKGVNTTLMKLKLDSIKDKLNQTDANIQTKDYFAAAQMLDSAKTLLAELQASISTAKPPELDVGLVVIVVVIIVAVGIFAYMMWPSGDEGFSLRKGWKKEETKESAIDAMIQKLKKKKEGYVPR